MQNKIKYDTIGRDKIIEYLKDCKNIYDIGAGFNKIREDAKTIDINPETNPNIYDDFNAEEFEIPLCDGICMSHSLEHCENTIRTLSRLYSSLTDGGKIAIAVPDGEDTCSETLGDAAHTHQQLYSPKILKTFLEYVGFENVKSEYYERPYAYKQTKGIFACGEK